MIQGFDPIRDVFLTNFSSLTQRMATTQAQLSSGKRVSKPSDDPTAVGDILQLEYDISNAQQTTSNLNSVKGAVDTAESALQTATTLLDQARSLGAQGANSTQTATSRGILAQQVQQILSQLVSITNTTYSGQFVFSGDQGGSPLYALDPTSATGVNRLAISSATQVIQDSSGVQFGFSKSSNEIFDHRNPDDTVASDNVFAAVNALQVALANNDSAGISTSLASLSTAQDYLGVEQSFYGATQNRITSSLDMAQKFQVLWQASLTQLRDTDIAAASTDLASENLNQQAALQAQASSNHGSLFDYLK